MTCHLTLSGVDGETETLSGRLKATACLAGPQTLTPWQVPPSIRLQVRGTGGSHPDQLRSKQSNPWSSTQGIPKPYTEAFPGLPHEQLPARHCTKTKPTRCVPTLKQLTVAWGAATRPPDTKVPSITVPLSPTLTHEDMDTS